jgi:tetratricopeptide (TPR) repeat protein
MLKRITFLISILGTTVCVKAQTSLIDSLKGTLLTEKEDTNTAKKLLTISVRYGQRADYDSSLVYAQKALDLSQGLKYRYGLASAYSTFAIIYKERANYPLSLENNFVALKIREEMGDKRLIAASLNNIATVYKELKDLPKALEYNQRSLKLKEEIHDDYGIAASLNNIATIVKAQGKLKEALDYNERALAIREKIKDEPGIALSLNNIGNVYGEWKEYEKAITYQLRAFKIRKEMGDHKGIAMSLTNLARIYKDKGDLRTALNYANNCVREVEAGGLLNEQIGIEEVIYKIYEKMKDFTAALQHYKTYVSLRDKVFNDENTKDEVRLEMNYEFEKKQAATKAEQEKKDAVAQAEQQRQKVIIYSVCTLLVLVALFAIYAYRSFRQKQKANIEISRQKDLIEEKQKEILDSIHYARRIQNALITSERYIERSLKRLRT